MVEEGGREGARTRKRAARTRRASGTERGGGRVAGGGGATARTLSHTHALPLHPRPLPVRGAARRRRGTVQPVGDARQLHARPRPLSPMASSRAPPPRPPWCLHARGPSMAPAQAARRRPRARGDRPRSPNPPGKRTGGGGGGRPSLSRARLGGKPSFSSFSSASFPPSSATPDPLRSSPYRSQQLPPAPLRMTVG